MKNIEVLAKYSNNPDFIEMNDELKFSLFAVDNEFFEGNATYDKVSEFIYNSESKKILLTYLFKIKIQTLLFYQRQSWMKIQ